TDDVLAEGIAVDVQRGQFGTGVNVNAVLVIGEADARDGNRGAAACGRINVASDVETFAGPAGIDDRRPRARADDGQFLVNSCAGIGTRCDQDRIARISGIDGRLNRGVAAGAHQQEASRGGSRTRTLNDLNVVEEIRALGRSGGNLPTGEPFIQLSQIGARRNGNIACCQRRRIVNGRYTRRGPIEQVAAAAARQRVDGGTADQDVVPARPG